MSRIAGTVLPAVQTAIKLPAPAAASDQEITLTVFLQWSDPSGFAAYSKSFVERGSPVYRRTLSPEEVTARFGPSQDAYDKVLAYLQQNGFALVEGSANHLTLTVRGTRGQAERAFGVTINDYQLGTRHFYANEGDPAVPQSLTPLIRSISGLSNLAQPHPFAAPAPSSPLSFATAYDGTVTPAGTGNTRGLPPGLNGAGETIALLEYDNYNPADLPASLVASQLPAALANQVISFNIAGGTGASGGIGTAEVLLDIVMALGIAPGASVIVADAPSSTPYIQVLNAIINRVHGIPGGRAGIISASWLQCEPEVSNGDADSMETLLQAARLYGVSVFVASGDQGSTCSDGRTTWANRVGFPAAAPDAIAVGGTTLQAGPGNAYQNESWWGGGGYGSSLHFGRPSYQDRWTTAAGRSVPDISADAGDAMMIICIGTTCQGYIGTSAATPLWAAHWALACQATPNPCGSAASDYLYTQIGLAGFHPASGMVGPGNDFSHVGLGSPSIANFVSLAAGPPTIGSISPNAGPVSGGTTVTINGNGFINVSSVRFAGAPAQSYSILSVSQIVAVSPPCPPESVCGKNSGAAGADIEVFTPAGVTITAPEEHFKYFAQVSGVLPNVGPMSGGTPVLVTGEGFSLGYNAPFAFGGIPAINAQCRSTTECDIGSPATSNPGTVDVTYAGSPATAQDKFTYTGPAVTNVSPSSGSENGGDNLVISGTSFSNAMTVMFGAVPITNFACDSGGKWCVLTSPPGTGHVDITVTVNGLTSAKNPGDVFTYAALPFGVMSPSSGTESGGTQVRVTGGNFDSAPAATVFTFNFPGAGSAPATNVACASVTTCTFTSPASARLMIGMLAPVTATVGGLTGPIGEFTYTPPLTPGGAVASITIDPETVWYGGSAQATVTIGALQPPQAVTVALTSSRPALASVPPSVTVPASRTVTSFTINTVQPHPPAPRFVNVIVTAAAGGTKLLAGLIVGAAPPPPHGGNPPGPAQ